MKLNTPPWQWVRQDLVKVAYLSTLARGRGISSWAACFPLSMLEPVQSSTSLIERRRMSALLEDKVISSGRASCIAGFECLSAIGGQGLRPYAFQFPSWRRKILTRKFRTECSYLQNSSLLTHPGLGFSLNGSVD